MPFFIDADLKKKLQRIPRPPLPPSPGGFVQRAADVAGDVFGAVGQGAGDVLQEVTAPARLLAAAPHAVFSQEARDYAGGAFADATRALSRPAAAARSALMSGQGPLSGPLGTFNTAPGEAAIRGFRAPETVPGSVEFRAYRGVPDTGLRKGPLNITPRTVLGTVTDIATDPLSYVPIGRGGKSAVELAERGAMKGARATRGLKVGTSVEDVGPSVSRETLAGDLPSFNTEGLTPATRELYGTLMERIKTEGWTPGNVQAYKELTGRDISALRGTMLSANRTAQDIVAANEGATARSLGGVPGQINPDMPFTGTPSETVQRLKYAIENGQAMNADALRQFRGQQAGGWRGATADTTGRAGLYKGLAAMQGKAERVGIKPLAEILGPELHDALVTQATHSPLLRDFEQATAGRALDNLIQNGRIPTFSEMRLLNQVFGPEVIQNPLKAIGAGAHPTFGDYMRDIVSLPQSLIANFDLSGLRQTATAAYGHPKMFARQFRNSLDALKSEENFVAFQDDLANRWYAGLREDAGVRLTSGGERALAKGEGTLISDLLNRWLPGYRPSQRAYTALVNGMRDGVFEKMVNGYGVGVEDVPLAELQRWGRLANISTGSGELPSFLANMQLADTPLFWAPRLFASRFEMPFEVFSKSAPVRKEAARQLVAFVGVNSALLGMLKASGAADVELDPRSSDFGQIRLGNIRIDPWFSFRPVANLVARMASGEIKSTTSGEFSKDRKAILTDFLRQKLSPVTSVATNLWTGENAIGQPYTGKDAIGDLVTPLFLRDIVEAIQEGGKAAPLVGLAGLGVGVNSYTSPAAEAQAGRYAGLEGADQLAGINAQAWQKLSTSKVAPPEVKQYVSYRVWADAQRKLIAPRMARANEALPPDKRKSPGELDQLTETVLNSLPAAKAYDAVRVVLKTQWVAANPQLALDNYDRNQTLSWKEQKPEWSLTQAQRDLAHKMLAGMKP